MDKNTDFQGVTDQIREEISDRTSISVLHGQTGHGQISMDGHMSDVQILRPTHQQFLVICCRRYLNNNIKTADRVCFTKD